MPATQVTSFGKLLWRYRLAAGFTQEELAERASLSTRGISDLERGVNHSPRKTTVQLLADALDLAPADRATLIAAAQQKESAPDPPSLPTPPSLPVSRTPFLGRADEVREVQSFLRSGSACLVTLTGPPGIGKTRLALAAAAGMVDHFLDGVYFVSLAPITDPNLVISAIAQALGQREAAGYPSLEQVQSFLRGKHLLLVLDNFEQVLAAAPVVSSLLAAATQVCILVTSRSRLRLYGEQVLSVQPLTHPDPRFVPGVDRLMEYPAVALFVHSAQAVQHTFALTPDNAAAVVTICHRLDGLPLAIELAAARIAILPPAALANRLDSRLSLLTNGPADLATRQQTLRGAIAWSYDLLDAVGQRLFRSLGVFVGGCSLEAVEAILEQSAPAPPILLDVLTDLVDRHLLKQDGKGEEPRFWMLETLREYALEQLRAMGEEQCLRQQHLAFFVQLAETADAALAASNEKGWLRLLEAEHENLRAALDWAFSGEGASSIADGVRLAQALWRFWYAHGYLREGQQWLLAALNSSPSLDPAVAATLRYRIGVLAHDQGDYVQASSLFNDSLALFRELNDKRGIASTLNIMGVLAGNQGAYAQAMRLFDESLALRRDLNDRRGVAAVLDNMGTVALFCGDYAAAQTIYEEGIVILDELGDQDHILAILLNNLGQVVRHQGDYAQARMLHEKSMAIKKELGDRIGIASSLHCLGEVAYAERDFDTAEQFYSESLALFQDLGDKSSQASLLYNLAQVARQRGNYERARRLLRRSFTFRRELNNRRGIALCLLSLATLLTVDGGPSLTVRTTRLLGAAHALLQALGVHLDPVVRSELETARAALQSRLDDTSFAAAWAAGQALTLEEAIAEAAAQW